MEEQNKLFLMYEGKTFYREQLWGKYVSFLPYTEQVTAITLQGFRYPLNRKDIRKGEEAGLCISNELAGDTATIEFEDGVLICVESGD